MFKKFVIKFGDGTYHRGSKWIRYSNPQIELAKHYDTLKGATGIFNRIKSRYILTPNSDPKEYYEKVEHMKIMEVTFTTTEVEV